MIRTKIFPTTASPNTAQQRICNFEIPDPLPGYYYDFTKSYIHQVVKTDIDPATSDADTMLYFGRPSLSAARVYQNLDPNGFGLAPIPYRADVLINNISLKTKDRDDYILNINTLSANMAFDSMTPELWAQCPDTQGTTKFGLRQWPDWVAGQADFCTVLSDMLPTGSCISGGFLSLEFNADPFANIMTQGQKEGNAGDAHANPEQYPYKQDPGAARIIADMAPMSGPNVSNAVAAVTRTTLALKTLDGNAAASYAYNARGGSTADFFTSDLLPLKIGGTYNYQDGAHSINDLELEAIVAFDGSAAASGIGAPDNIPYLLGCQFDADVHTGGTADVAPAIRPKRMTPAVTKYESSVSLVLCQIKGTPSPTGGMLAIPGKYKIIYQSTSFNPPAAGVPISQTFSVSKDSIGCYVIPASSATNSYIGIQADSANLFSWSAVADGKSIVNRPVLISSGLHMLLKKKFLQLIGRKSAAMSLMPNGPDFDAAVEQPTNMYNTSFVLCWDNCQKLTITLQPISGGTLEINAINIYEIAQY